MEKIKLIKKNKIRFYLKMLKQEVLYLKGKIGT